MILVTQGYKRSSQKAKVEILNAGGEYRDSADGEDINNDSMVIMLSYKGVKVLLTGDIEELAETAGFEQVHAEFPVYLYRKPKRRWFHFGR